MHGSSSSSLQHPHQVPLQQRAGSGALPQQHPYQTMPYGPSVSHLTGTLSSPQSASSSSSSFTPYNSTSGHQSPAYANAYAPNPIPQPVPEKMPYPWEAFIDKV
jgi:hypothetical protein